MRSPGKRALTARATDRPPNPESRMPMGSSLVICYFDERRRFHSVSRMPATIRPPPAKPQIPRRSPASHPMMAAKTLSSGRNEFLTPGKEKLRAGKNRREPEDGKNESGRKHRRREGRHGPVRCKRPDAGIEGNKEKLREADFRGFAEGREAPHQDDFKR